MSIIEVESIWLVKVLIHPLKEQLLLSLNIETNLLSKWQDEQVTNR